ncbi:MAG: site-2 protease family protein [Rubricoccaceae bacterium]
MGRLRLGRFFGIDVFLHWTFVLLIVGAFAFFLLGGRGVNEALGGVGLIAAVFACVVLHEYGHALMARRFGVPTKDITLYPIGGVARLQRLPEDPKQELLIALAGPAVNVVLALAIYAWLALSGTPLLAPTGLLGPAGAFWSNLLWLNVVLVAFNMLPAFPMDGGRVLRALLAFRLDYARATRIAAGVGQGMAILFGLLAVMPPFNPFLLFIALFVYLGAQQEAHAALMRAAVRGVPVREAMLTQFSTLGPASRLSDAVALLLDGSEQEFPVLGVDGQVAGVLTRKALVQALAERDASARVYDVMERACPPVDAGCHLDEAMERMQEHGCSVLPVTQHGRLVGILTLENVGELMMLASAIERRTGVRPPAHAVRPSVGP